MEEKRNEGQKIGEEIGKKIGEELGKEIGESRVNELNRQLIKNGRVEDIIKAAEDKTYQEKLLKEFAL